MRDHREDLERGPCAAIVTAIDERSDEPGERGVADLLESASIGNRDTLARCNAAPPNIVREGVKTPVGDTKRRHDVHWVGREHVRSLRDGLERIHVVGSILELTIESRQE